MMLFMMKRRQQQARVWALLLLVVFGITAAAAGVPADTSATTDSFELDVDNSSSVGDDVGSARVRSSGLPISQRKMKGKNKNIFENGTLEINSKEVKNNERGHGKKCKKGKKKDCISDETKDKFNAKHNVKEGYEIEYLEELDPVTNSITLPDGSVTTIDLATMTPKSVLSNKGATCRLNSQPIPCPLPTVYTKQDEDTGRIIQVHTDGKGNINQISIIDEVVVEEEEDVFVVVEGKKKKKEKISLEVIGEKDIYVDDDSGKLEIIGNVVFTYLPDDAVDVDYLDSHYHMQSTGDVDEEERRNRLLLRDPNARSFLRKGNNNDMNKMSIGSDHRDLQVVNGDCDEYREVEVAIAADSAFCNDEEFDDDDDAYAKIYSVMSDVSDYYEVEGLCLVMTIVFVDMQCDSRDDPYQDFDLSQSGCGGSGLLVDFRKYWNEHFDNVDRDVAQFFSGHGFSCNKKGSCVIGCAYVEDVCNNSAYGVNWVTYSDDQKRISTLVAHEIGHNLGAGHDGGSENNVMYPSVGNASNKSFSNGSKRAFLGYADDHECFAPFQEAPTASPTVGPTASPTLSASPSASLEPSSSPSLSPSPSSSPSSSPTTDDCFKSQYLCDDNEYAVCRRKLDKDKFESKCEKVDKILGYEDDNKVELAYCGCCDNDPEDWCPTRSPTSSPTYTPTIGPTVGPTAGPTTSGTDAPSVSMEPSSFPSSFPSMVPSSLPSAGPSNSPSSSPSEGPSSAPSSTPSSSPSSLPSAGPSNSPSSSPSESPSSAPSSSPSSAPSSSPSFRPSPSPSLSSMPSETTDVPSTIPTIGPTRGPTSGPTTSPSTTPTIGPTSGPTIGPTTSEISLDQFLCDDKPKWMVCQNKKNKYETKCLEEKKILKLDSKDDVTYYYGCCPSAIANKNEYPDYCPDEN